MAAPLFSGVLRIVVALSPLAACGEGQEQEPHRNGHPPSEPAACENTFEALRVASPDGNVAPEPMEAVLPELLSDTILYADIGTLEVHPALREYTPAYQLWSDNAEKRRWAYIPECEPIDNTDPDNWVMPVGATLFKEFQIDGRRVETRVLVRLGSGAREFAYASYLWNADESDAIQVGPEGLLDVDGSHDIPSKEACLQCHGTSSLGGGRPSRTLGFSPLQLDHAGSGLSLEQLASEGQLLFPPGTTSVPGDAVAQAALGYLHANCGNCHNPSEDGVPDVDLDLWLAPDHQDVEQTGAWRTAVNQSNTLFNDQNVHGRIVPGDPEGSSVWFRMNQRGSIAQMPPIATEEVDPSGLDAVRLWIESLQ